MIVHFPYRGPDLRDTTETEKDTDNLEDREKREKFARSRFHACPRRDDQRRGRRLNQEIVDLSFDEYEVELESSSIDVC
jgi:hypothetical protein